MRMQPNDKLVWKKVFSFFFCLSWHARNFVLLLVELMENVGKHKYQLENNVLKAKACIMFALVVGSPNLGWTFFSLLIYIHPD